MNERIDGQLRTFASLLMHIILKDFRDLVLLTMQPCISLSFFFAEVIGNNATLQIVPPHEKDFLYHWSCLRQNLWLYELYF